MTKSKMAVMAGAVAAVTLLGAVGGAYAGVFGSGGPEKKAFRFISAHVDNMLDDVAATDAQRQQVYVIRDDMFEQGKGLKVGMEGAKAELKAQWAKPQPDATRVHQLVDERIDAVRAFAHKAADSVLKLHDILNPEQRAQLAKLHEEHEHGGARW